MNSALQVRAIYLVALVALVACSERQPSQSDAANASKQSGDSAQLSGAAVGEHEDVRESGDTITADVAAGGVPTTYVAHFENEKLTRVEEIRRADRSKGSYEFYGARLLKYSGSAIGSAATLDLTFDPQGALQSAHSSAGNADPADISVIRDRAQLLRSHALAQRSTRTHKVN